MILCCAVVVVSLYLSAHSLPKSTDLRSEQTGQIDTGKLFPDFCNFMWDIGTWDKCCPEACTAGSEDEAYNNFMNPETRCQKMCTNPRYPVCSRAPRLVESVAPSKAMKRDPIKVETLKLTPAPLRLAVVVAFPLHQVNDMWLLAMMWDNVDFYPCNLPSTRKRNIDFVLYGADARATQKAQQMLELGLLESGAVKDCFGEIRVSGMQEDSQLKELELTWAVANTAAVKDLAALGPNREGKITRAGFKAGGGSDADFDRYRNGWKAGSNDGFLDITQLEARAAAQIMAVKDLAAMGPHSDGKVTRAGFKTGGGGHADFDRYDSDKDGMLDLSELEARAAVNTMRGKHDGYYYGAPAMFFGLWRNSQLLSWNYDYMFWCEPDVVPVRHGWLDALYEEIHFMAREGIWQKGSSPQYAHAVDHVSSLKTVEHELFHINGNSIYDFKSAEFRKFLTEAAGTIPNSFDFSIYSHLHQHDAEQYQLVTQGALKRFQYTGLIMNNPTDLCIPTLGAFLNRYPQVSLVHGKAVKFIRMGSTCCNLFEEKAATIHRQHSDQYHCLLGEHGIKFVAESWFEDGPVHLSLEQIDKIALGGLSGEPIPHMAPVQNCFLGRSAAIAATKGSKLVGAIGATEASCCLDSPLMWNDTGVNANLFEQWNARQLVLMNLNRSSMKRQQWLDKHNLGKEVGNAHCDYSTNPLGCS